MSNTILFIIGTFIFLSYLFFLLRMIWKQHQIQKKEETQVSRQTLRKVDGELDALNYSTTNQLESKSMVSFTRL